MKMEYQKKKIELIQWLSTLENPDVIDELLMIRKSDRADWWQMISESEKHSIETGIREADEGRLASHDEVKKSYEKWL
jgi:hypothetical protein